MVAAADGRSIVIPPEYQVHIYVGRATLQQAMGEEKGFRVLDAFAGIATLLLCLTQAELPVLQYWYNEKDQRTREVAAAAVARIQREHPEHLAAGALEHWDTCVAADITDLAQGADKLFSNMRELPTFLSGAIPCTDTSLAGEGAGLRGGSRSSLVYEFVRVMHTLYREYKRRGWQQPHAPFVWMVETSAVAEIDERPAVREAMQALEAMLGQPITLDAVWAGAGCHRRTMLFSNMTRSKEEFAAIQNTPEWEIITPIREYLRGEESYQVMETHHVSIHYPHNKLGHYLARFPKFVRRPNSYKFRADYYGPGKHGPGRILLGKGRSREPTLIMKEGSLRYPKGYAAFRKTPDCPVHVRIPRGRLDLRDTPEELQHQLYGNCFCPALVTRFLQEAYKAGIQTQNSQQMAEGSQSVPKVKAHSARAAAATAGQRHDDSNTLPPPTAPSWETIQARGLPTLAEALDAAVDEDYWLLDVAQDSAATTTPMPPLMPPAETPERRTAMPVALPLAHPEIQRAMAHLQGYFSRVALMSSRPAECTEHVPQPQWEEWLRGEVIRDEQQFVMGNLHRHAEVWAAMARQLPATIRNKALCKRVMRLIRTGMTLQFVHPQSDIQQSHPRYKQRMTRAWKALTRTYGEAEARRLIDRKTPGEVHLPNMRSYEEHLPFVLETLHTDLLPKGKVARWWWPEGKPPIVISPIGVDVRPVTGKKRLVFDHNYVNIFCRYQKMQYETLDDLVSMAEEGGVGATGDTSAGYHHIAVADKYVPYFGFVIEGDCYVYLCCPFGTAIAPSLYTDITTFQFQHARTQGLRLVTFIDDWAVTAPSPAQGRFLTAAVHLLLSSLGWALSVHKLQLHPQQYFEFLGMGVHLSAPAHFVVPEMKLQAIMSMLQKMLTAKSFTFREIAQVAGKIISIRRAVHLAPLLCRDLWSALVGVTDWENVYSQPERCRPTLQYLADNLEHMNGRRMWSRQRGIIVAGDASAVGFGAYPVALDAIIPADVNQLQIPDQATMDAWGLQPFRTSFSNEDAMRAETQEYSSSSRELDCLLSWLRTVTDINSHVLRRTAMLYLTDSQVAANDINRMAGGPTTLPIVRQIWELCTDLDLELEARWLPREHQLMAQADRDSKVADESSWAISDCHFEFLCALWQVSPNLDPFADSLNHRADRFFSLDLCPKTAGVDAFKLPWTVPGQHRVFAWVNPPFHKMHEVLTKIEAEKVDCILIAPEWNKSWVARLPSLPIVQKQRLHTRNSVGKEISIFTPGARVPKRQQLTGLKRNPRYAVWAYLLVWPRP